MSTCAVSFDTGTLTGAVLPNAKLVFQSADGPLRAVGARVAPADRYEVTADAAGAGTITLAWGNWTVTMITALGQQTAAFSVPQAGSGRLEAMIGAPLTSIYSLIQLSVLAAGGRGLFETPAAGRAATVNGEIFLAPIGASGVGIYRRDSAASSPQVGSFFTGEVTATPTDITAGRLLKVGDYGLGVPIGFYTANIDAISVNGLYRMNTGAFSTASPSPGLGAGQYLEHKQFDTNVSYQTLEIFNGDRFLRTKLAGVWSQFFRVYNASNVIGPVSQSGGVLTGRLIERGSNANGRFTRFADGTQICRFAMNSLGGANTVWTFPVAFSAAPDGISVIAGATSVRSPALAAVTTTNLEFNIYTASDVRVSAFVRLTAIGDWF